MSCRAFVLFMQTWSFVRIGLDGGETVPTAVPEKGLPPSHIF